jgi:hypothetical protein
VGGVVLGLILAVRVIVRMMHGDANTVSNSTYTGQNTVG